MDDVNCAFIHGVHNIFIVQIPLWTMLTGSFYRRSVMLEDSSDSSMDDVNSMPIYLSEDFLGVQIPLWTMLTGEGTIRRRRFLRFRFLYGRC